MFGIVNFIMSFFFPKSNSPTRNVDPPSNDQFHEESQENQNVNHRQKRYLEFRYIDLKNNNAVYSSTPAILSK